MTSHGFFFKVVLHPHNSHQVQNLNVRVGNDIAFFFKLSFGIMAAHNAMINSVKISRDRLCKKCPSEEYAQKMLPAHK